MTRLFVIPGHGAGDPGACGNGFSEAERVRALAQRIKDFGGDNVWLSDFNRDYYADNGISSLDIPGDMCIVELHMDAASAGARGGHVIIQAGAGGADNYDYALADLMGRIFPGRSNLIVERNDLANPWRALSRGFNYRLVENGFITNADDVATFNSRMDEIAQGYLSAFGISTTGGGESEEERRAREEAERAAREEEERRMKEAADLKEIVTPNAGGEVYRLYNPNTGDHMFTSDAAERDMLVENGWQSEGTGWSFPPTPNTVYRFYNHNVGDHMWTLNFEEAKALQEAGWTYEGANFSSNEDGTPVYRLYNANNGKHMFTVDTDERDTMISAGWQDEGIAFYAVKDE